MFQRSSGRECGEGIKKMQVPFSAMSEQLKCVLGELLEATC